MSDLQKWDDVRQSIDAIYAAVRVLERTFPGRKFTPDGHLVGSIGEVAASYIFDLTLNPASTLGHDARSRCGKQVEVKLTQGKTVALRHEPEHLIVMCRPRGGKLGIVYNGPGDIAWRSAGKVQKNGQRPIGISKLARLQSDVLEFDKLPALRELYL